MPLFLTWFTIHPEYHEFRLQELESLSQCFGVEKDELWVEELPEYVSWHEKKYKKPLGNDHSNSFAWVNLPNENIALQILERSVLIRGFIQVWSSDTTHEKVQRILKENGEVKNFFLKKYINDDIDFCWEVKAIGKKLSRKEQISRMNDYGFLFKGTERVNLKNPSLSLIIFEDWRSIYTHEIEEKIVSKKQISKLISTLKRIYLGRIIGIQNWNKTDKKTLWWLKYSLNKRPILGPTTMDNELSFIMCNIAQVKKDDIIFDPFCGTGGILISASHLGAICFGSDLDLRVINGWFCSYVNPHMIKNQIIDEKFSKSIFSNFDYYNLQRPEIIRMDISRNSIKSSWIDAIICDPPYGIRATSRTTNRLQQTDNYKKNNISSNYNNFIQEFNNKKGNNMNLCLNRKQYGTLQSIDEMIYDLLTFSTRTLVDNGHLVFLLPLLISESNLVISNLIEISKNVFEVDFPYMQILGGGIGRLLVHMTLSNRNAFQQKTENEFLYVVNS